MRRTRSLLALTTPFVLAAVACQASSSDVEPAQPAPLPGRALHEAAFALDPALRARPGDTLIVNLEASAAHPDDTGGAGFDSVPVRATHDTEVPLCIGESAIPYQLLVRDADGEELLALDNGECATLPLAAGDEVVYELHHGAAGLEAESALVFVRPEPAWGPREPAGTAPPAATAASKFTQPYATCDTQVCCWWEDKRIDWEMEAMVPCQSISAYVGLQEGKVLPRHYCGKDYDGWPCADIEYYCGEVLEDGPDECAYRASRPGFSTGYHCQQEWCDSWQAKLEPWCAKRQAECEAATNGTIPPACAGSVERVVPYSDVVTTGSDGKTTIDLDKGEVAVIPAVPYIRGVSQCPPEYPDQPVFVLTGPCADLGFNAHGLVAGPETQVIGYEEASFDGEAHLVRGPLHELPDACSGAWAPDAAGHLHCADWRQRERYRSVAVSPIGAEDAERCVVLQSGQWCDFGGACPGSPRSTVDYPQPGEALVLGPIDPAGGDCCAPAHLMPTGSCTDLGLIGLEGQLSGVILPNADAATDPLGRTIEYEEDASSVTAYAAVGTGELQLELTRSTAPSDPAIDPSGHFRELPADGPTVTRTNASSLEVLSKQGRNRRRMLAVNDCEGCDLSGVILCGQHLEGTKLAGADLSGAVLNGATLEAVDLSHATLNEAKLHDATLAGADLTCVSMRDVDTRSDDDPTASTLFLPEGVTLTHGNAASGSCRSDYSGAALPIQLFPRSRWSYLTMEGAALLDLEDGYELQGLDMSQGRFRGLHMGQAALNLWGADLHEADLRSADLARVDLGARCGDGGASCTGANLRGARLSDANLAYTNLWLADLTGAFLNAYDDEDELDDDGNPAHYSGARASYAFMRDAVLDSAHLEGASLSYVHLYGDHVTLDGALLRKVQLTNAVLAGVSFSGATVDETSFAGAVLTNADFSSTTIRSSTFTGASIQGARFAGAAFGGDATNFTNATPSDTCMTWTFRGLDCEAYEVQIQATSFPTGSEAVICPSSSSGPCGPDEMIPPAGWSDTPACVPGQSGTDNEWYSPCSLDDATPEQPQTVAKCASADDCGCLVSLEETPCAP